ncbi:MAG TPA: DEAD/DEAH box helicase [Gammaproteobacteria bacterium]|nr:DEAD/DEAH box helicase [Gammaproteobacteria bacterium]
MATKKQAAGNSRSRRPAIGQGWRTTDADEIERRRQRADSEELQVSADTPDGALFGAYSVQSRGDRNYRVEFRSTEQPINSCDCPDYEVNGLGTCKHIEAVRRHVRNKRVPAERVLTEVFLDRSDQYGAGPKVRVQWADRLSADDPVHQAVGPFFGDDDVLVGDPADAIPALRRTLDEAQLGPDVVRLSAHIAPWVERLQRQRRCKSERTHFLADVAAGKRDLDVLRSPLYEYQQEGMLHLAFSGRAILADDMGLGKTVQAVAACELLRRLQGIERVLVISPVSLKTEWEEQIERFTDLATQVIAGRRAERLREYQRPAFFNLANYEQILYDGDDIQRLLAPDVIILDEAQRIKNWQTKTADAVKRLSSPYAFVLTGTPLENRIDEVYSIAQVVDPHIFGPLFRFNRDFHELDAKGRPVGYKNLDELHRRLRPILLRRRKADVESELPERTVNTYFVAMHEEQRTRYEEYSASVARLAQAARRRPLSPDEFKRLQQQLACMRMLCDTPYILDSDCRVSPKLEELIRIFDDQLSEPDNKIIVFSEWTRMLELVRERAEAAGIGYALHTGQVPQRQRSQQINRFKQDPACRLLLSSDAGATGLNLQAANVVINLDLPWNPARLEQRIARAWRKHQQRHVSVINLVCENSIEHRILHLLDQKRALAEGVLEGTGEPEMALPSGRRQLMERLESLMGTRLAAPEPAPTEAPSTAVQLEDLPPELEARHPQGLEAMGVYASSSGQQTVLAVVHGDATARREELLSTAARTQAKPNVEVVDRDTLAVIQRLADAGVLSLHSPQQMLHGAAAKLAQSEGNKRQRQLQAARKRLSAAERKLGMARVLTQGGFEHEALGPLSQALEEALAALGDSTEAKLASPIPLGQVRSELAPKAGLDDKALALLAILREQGDGAPPDAFDTVSETVERIGAFFDRQLLE